MSDWAAVKRSSQSLKLQNLAKTIKQNRATGQYLSTNANTGANASVNLIHHERTQVT